MPDDEHTFFDVAPSVAPGAGGIETVLDQAVSSIVAATEQALQAAAAVIVAVYVLGDLIEELRQHRALRRAQTQPRGPDGQR